MTTESEYQTWRLELHNYQLKLDEHTENFWVSVTDDEGNLVDQETYQKAKDVYETEHNAMLQEFEAIHQRHPGYPS